MKEFSSLLFGGIALILASTGCNQEKPMDSMAVQQRADSIYNSRKVSVMESMIQDCQTSMNAMVQMKADSIYRADSLSMAMSHK